LRRLRLWRPRAVRLTGTLLHEPQQAAQFVYAPDRSRLKQISTYAGNTETTIYVAGLFEKLKCHPVVLVLPGWEVARESAA
jgi:hypothetical protein